MHNPNPHKRPSAPSYREAVELIALNDEPGETKITEIADLMSVSVVADLFKLKRLEVARDISMVRSGLPLNLIEDVK